MAWSRPGFNLADTVALWAPNSNDWAIASLAVLFAGATVVPLNTRYTAREASDIVTRARCRFVVASGLVPRPLPRRRSRRDAGGAGRRTHRHLVRSRGHRRCGLVGGPRSAPAVGPRRSSRDCGLDARPHQPPSVHVGHHRAGEGRHAAPRTDGRHHRGVGGGGGRAAGRPLPGGEPVLPYRRAQDGAAREPPVGRDRLPVRDTRSRPSGHDDRVRARHGAARPADDVLHADRRGP